MTITTPSAEQPELLAVDDAAGTDLELVGLFSSERGRWAAVDPSLERFLDEVAEFALIGGKRLRPALVHAGYEACGGRDDDPRVARVGAAVELLHAFALLHDDVMDGAARRRGRPSFHESRAADHRARRHRGEARRYGEGVAVLAGDLAHVYADSIMTSMPSSVRAVWTDLRIEVTMGQLLDLEAAATARHDRRRACVVAEHKTGRYTVERPLHLGAALAGRFDDVAGHLTAYGRPLGVAFQHRDDLLGAIGDPERTGKPVGDDLREGKPTLVMAIAHERATPTQRAVLQRVGDASLTADDVAEIQSVLRSCGAVDEVERTIARLRDQALEALARAPLTATGKQRLAGLANVLTDRER
jgi:geranylgeranyl diphosphate synthase type I